MYFYLLNLAAPEGKQTFKLIARSSYVCRLWQSRWTFEKEAAAELLGAFITQWQPTSHSSLKWYFQRGLILHSCCMLNISEDNESITCRQRKIKKSEERKDRGDVKKQNKHFLTLTVPFKRILVCIHVSIDIYRDQRLKWLLKKSWISIKCQLCFYTVKET